MRGQITFIMHPKDEKEFVSYILSKGFVIITDQRFKTKQPPVEDDIQNIESNHCYLCYEQFLPLIKTEYIPSCNDYTLRNISSLIQFLRSEIKDNIITEGRIAIMTTDKYTKEIYNPKTNRVLEKYFKDFRNWIKKSYKNNQNLVWDNGVKLGTSKFEWFSPKAIDWLKTNKNRLIKQDLGYKAGFKLKFD